MFGIIISNQVKKIVFNSIVELCTNWMEIYKCIFTSDSIFFYAKDSSLSRVILSGDFKRFCDIITYLTIHIKVWLWVEGPKSLLFECLWRHLRLISSASCIWWLYSTRKNAIRRKRSVAFNLILVRPNKIFKKREQEH